MKPFHFNIVKVASWVASFALDSRTSFYVGLVAAWSCCLMATVFIPRTLLCAGFNGYNLGQNLLCKCAHRNLKFGGCPGRSNHVVELSSHLTVQCRYGPCLRSKGASSGSSYLGQFYLFASTCVLAFVFGGAYISAIVALPLSVFGHFCGS